MTLDEIKRIPMREIVERYGFTPNRAGFIHCPFHQGDKGASLKVYARDWHCHACGAHGDQIDFVRRMDGLSFKEAFVALGGTYEKPTFHSKMTIYHSKKTRETSEKKKKKKYYTMKEISESITKYRKQKEDNEPFSDEWCEAVNELEYLLYVYEEMYKIYCQC